MDEFPYPICGSVIKNQCMEQIQPKNGKIYNAREDIMNILIYVAFSKMCHVINFFPELNQKLGKKKLLFLFHQVQEPFNGNIYLREL